MSQISSHVKLKKVMSHVASYDHRERASARPLQENLSVSSPCRIPQRVQNSRIPKQTKAPIGHTKNGDMTRPFTKNLKLQSLQPRKSSNQNDGSMTSRPSHPKTLSARAGPRNAAKSPKSPKSPVSTLEQESVRERNESLHSDQNSTTTELDNVFDAMKSKMSWVDKIHLFEKLKEDLGQRQKYIMELFISIKHHHKMITALGQNVTLPPVNELNIMNVAQMNPEQLLQLCNIGKNPDELFSWDSTVNTLNVDLDKLTNLPTKLVTTCDLTLAKRKEIIDWFETLKKEEKGITMTKLTKKINEFNAENEMLANCVQKCKSDFVAEVIKFVENLRVGISEAVSLQLRIEDLRYKLSQLSIENDELRKQIHASDQTTLQNTKAMIEGLQEELKEERGKKAILKEKSMRAENQVKVATERTSQLEAALELARSQNWTLERNVTQLTEENQQLQLNFETELNKLNESIKENTKRLEEIAEAREKLQVQKQNLQQRLETVTADYNRTTQSLKEELSSKTEKLAKAENNLNEANETKRIMEAKINELRNAMVEAELRYKEMLNREQNKDEQISKLMKKAKELENTNKELETANREIDRLTEIIREQNNNIRAIQANFIEMGNIEDSMKSDIKRKDEYIAELEIKVADMEKTMAESQCKIQDSENRVRDLQKELEQIHQDLGEYGNISKLRELISRQQNELLEMTSRNTELAEAIQNKEQELHQKENQLAEMGHTIEEKVTLLKIVSNKEQEQVNIIKLLRHNLEMRTKADFDLNQQLSEKTAEVNTLHTSLDTRKKQISQLEKIILTLQGQLEKICFERRIDREKIMLLEKAINETESDHIVCKASRVAPSEDLEQFIKALEEELDAADHIDGKYIKSEKAYTDPARSGRMECPADDLFVNDEYFKLLIQSENGSPHTETRKGLVRKDAIFNEMEERDKTKSSSATHNFPVIDMLTNQRSDKKRKMFKFAGHKF